MGSKQRDDIVKAWADLYESGTLRYHHSKQRNHRTAFSPGNLTAGVGDSDISEDEAFAQLFHSLVHSSPSLSVTLAQLEHDHAVAVSRKCAERDEALSLLDPDVEPDQLQILKAKWESDISHLKETQKREFRNWVAAVSDQVRAKDSENGIAPMSKSDSAYFMASSGISAPAPPSGSAVTSSLQESFTITLGSQMKHTHNLRLVAADAVDLCRYDILGTDGFGQEEEWLPRRLQTAMSLYSHSLSGLVLLTADDLSGENDVGAISRKFSDICSRSTEYHFPNFEQQMESLRVRSQKSDGREKPKCGDFYVTRHANLCEVHAVYHMIASSEKEDDVPDLKSSEKVNSRHPVVMGLRSVLKTSSVCGVTTLTVPLLLTASLSEETSTVGWCLKRAELVFKCVKGFMMEVASCGGGEDLKTLQFVVPKDIDRDVFLRLTSMLASIFRSSNPIKGN